MRASSLGADAGGKTELWARGVEDTVVSVEEDIAVDVLAAGADALETTEAGLAGGICGSKVQNRSRNGSIIRVPNHKAEGWQVGSTGESVATLGVVQLGA